MHDKSGRAKRTRRDARHEGGREAFMELPPELSELGPGNNAPKGRRDGRTDGGPFSINLVVRPFVRGAAAGQNTVVGTSQKHTHAEPRSREEDDDKRQCAESNDSLKK